MSLFSCNCYQRGPALIGLGLIFILSALLIPGTPIAGAIVIIGWGATLSYSHASTERQILSGVVHTAIYGSLACMAGGAALDRSARNPGEIAELVALADCALATVLIFALAKQGITRFSEETDSQQ